MTKWSPDTCSCILQYDANLKWIKTHQTCELHNSLTGQKLLDEVLRHNRDNNKKSDKKGILEIDWMEVQVEPQWLSEIKKFPSLLKIEESEFFLQGLENSHLMDKQFQFALSGFLNASRSILWHLLEEYSDKYKIKLDFYFKNEKYRQKNSGTISGEPIF